MLIVGLVSVSAVLFAIWVLTAINMWRRLQRVEHRLRSGPLGKTPRRNLLWEIPGVLVDAAVATGVMTVTSVVFLLGCVWYKVRGKPLPPPPR